MSAIVYPAQGVLSLVSRAWNLFRANLSVSLTLMILPTVLLTLVSVFMGLPASLPTLSDNPISTTLVSLGFIGIGLALFLVSGVVWGFASAALIRIYYSAIVREEPLTLKEVLAFVRGIWPALLAIIVGISILWIIFTVVNLVVYFTGVLGSFSLFTAFGFFNYLRNPGNMPMMMLSILIFLIWGFMVLALLTTLLITQSFACAFPFIAVSTSGGKQLGQRILYGWRLMLASLGRMVPFGFTFFLFTLVLSIVLHLPIMVWITLEMMRLGVNHAGAQPFVMPFHVNLINNLWSSLVNMFLIPYSLGAWTLFWYDCQVRKEGLDLKLGFQNILKQRGLEPGAYFSQT